ncbi:MAG: beta-glucosidase [Deltaproteobacteria bacterium]|nr:beta-glucosidase [Deltaproteobacteria bacterium]
MKKAFKLPIIATSALITLFTLAAFEPILVPKLYAATDRALLLDREALDELQRSAFLYFWEFGDPNSGAAYEADFGWDVRPITMAGTGFGITALVVATDRGWVTREQAVERLLKITGFLLDISKPEWHGGFPHWLNGDTGEPFDFENDADVIDVVETSFLIQGLLMARQYFNGPGAEADFRREATLIWENMDWAFFTDNQGAGLFWTWSPAKGFLGLKIKGFNEALITYVLAASSPTHPIDKKTFEFWYQGPNYRKRNQYGYSIEGGPNGGGPLFITHYSFLGLDPRTIADEKIPSGYYIRGVTQVLANREYCITFAPRENRYSENFWGLTASQKPDEGYEVFTPFNDKGILAPTAALSSMPFTPHYSMEVLNFLSTRLKDMIWSWYGPRDAISLKDDWVSPHYLAIDQLPIVTMVENYRSGLPWRLFMANPEIKEGLNKLGFFSPKLENGFPEAVLTRVMRGGKYRDDAYITRRHPDSGLYQIPYYISQGGQVSFSLVDSGEPSETELFKQTVLAEPGSNTLLMDLPMDNGRLLTLKMTTMDGTIYSLPMRLY